MKATKTQPTKKFALPLLHCDSMGRAFAAAGWSARRINAWLIAEGFKTNGLTARRIFRAMAEQMARG